VLSAGIVVALGMAKVALKRPAVTYNNKPMTLTAKQPAKNILTPHFGSFHF